MKVDVYMFWFLGLPIGIALWLSLTGLIVVGGYETYLQLRRMIRSRRP